MCAKSNSNRKLLTISLVFLSCGSNAAHGCIFYTKDEETPLKTVEWIDFFVSFFLFEIFAVIIWFQKYPFDLDGQIGTLGFKLPSTVAESMSIVQLRGRKPPSLILMSVISPTEGVRERPNHQSSPVCPAEWTIPLSLHLLSRRPTVGRY